MKLKLSILAEKSVFSLQSLEKYFTLTIVINKFSSESEFIAELDLAQGQDNIN